jgi:hypothetical protein
MCDTILSRNKRVRVRISYGFVEGLVCDTMRDGIEDKIESIGSVSISPIQTSSSPETRESG